MTGPQYIRLTATKIVFPPERKGAAAQMHILQPPAPRLIPLPLQLFGSPIDGKTEIDMGHSIVTFAELFEDVLSAMEAAHKAGEIVARPIARDVPHKAARAATGAPSLQQQLDDAVKGAMTGIDKALNAVGYAKDRAPVPDAMTWDDAGMGNKLPDTKAGDLRIVERGSNQWAVAAREVDGDAWRWGPDQVPSELKAIFGSREAAESAIKVAGYRHRLVQD